MKKYLYFNNYQVFQTKNVLHMMLMEDETKRISSYHLALITQSDKVLFSNIQVPHIELFPPLYQPIEKPAEKSAKTGYKEQQATLTYTIKSLVYEGEVKREKNSYLREGSGKLYKLVNNQKILLYEGFWKKDGKLLGISNFLFFPPSLA